MPSIIGKRRGARTYYYLAESARVDGKPRIVSQEYLGTAEEVMARLKGGDTELPERTQHRRFGEVAATWSIIDELGIAEVVDQVSGPGRAEATDLRLVGLGLVVTRDGGIPLLSHAYPGNRPDVTQFPALAEAVIGRYGDVLGDAPQATIVFDAGQNSADNFTRLARLGLHFVGSVPPSDHPGLLARPATDRHLVDVERFDQLTALEDRVSVLGAVRRVVLTHSPGLHQAQQVGFAQTVGKASGQLTELAARLERGKTRRLRQAVEADIDRIVKPRWVGRVLRTELTGATPADLRLRWWIDAAAHAELEEEIFGKRILVTDHDEWPIAEMIAAYRSQAESRRDSASSKTPTWCPSRRCSTGPTKRSASIC
ncbi:hypothetical protein [Nonomuraea basaltis]|uniref:IS1634 family transposase n=1 Tax=Nonomuraea basaltis TaxID=2495887 RepID=UPI00197E874D|nr:hypothetical protein [Nonomuraea basaltis]